jgi:hypothetical protein
VVGTEVPGGAVVGTEVPGGAVVRRVDDEGTTYRPTRIPPPASSIPPATKASVPCAFMPVMIPSSAEGRAARTYPERASEGPYSTARNRRDQVGRSGQPDGPDRPGSRQAAICDRVAEEPGRTNPARCGRIGASPASQVVRTAVTVKRSSVCTCPPVTATTVRTGSVPPA